MAALAPAGCMSEVDANRLDIDDGGGVPPHPRYVMAAPDSQKRTETKMSHQKSVLLIGWDPEVTDYSKWPGMTKEGLSSALAESRETLLNDGYEAKWCLVTSAETAEAEVRAELEKQAYDCVLIGGGVRVDPGSFAVFEKLINAIHELAPSGRICFNSSLGDIAESAKRWL